jgi:glycosyltransferase involved in cell wall biosynthesis
MGMIFTMRSTDKNFSNRLGRKYNIVFIIDGLGMGGAERLMIPILRNLSRENFEPRVCVLQVKDDNPVANDIRALGVPVDLLPVLYLRDITAIPRIRKYLREVKADLVHTQLEFADSLGNFASKLLRLPSVCTIHTMPSQDMNVKSKFHQSVETQSLRFFCNRIIAVSEEARLFYIKTSNESPKKVITIYNGIDLTNFVNIDAHQERIAIRKELGIPLEANLLTTVAVLRPLKGIQFMIRALPAVLEATPNVYYLIVGDGSHHDALVEEVDKAGVKERVVFAGLRKDIPQLLAASDIFVLPTLTEALPTVLAEAMAARLPIVACAVGGVPEMVVDGENGRLVSPGIPQELSNACIGLVTDPEMRNKMGERGWQIVNEKFDVQGQVGQLGKLYLDLIGDYGR